MGVADERRDPAVAALGRDGAGHGLPDCRRGGPHGRRESGPAVAPRDAGRSVDLDDGWHDPLGGDVGGDGPGHRLPDCRQRRLQRRRDGRHPVAPRHARRGLGVAHGRHHEAIGDVGRHGAGHSVPDTSSSQGQGARGKGQGQEDRLARPVFGVQSRPLWDAPASTFPARSAQAHYLLSSVPQRYPHVRRGPRSRRWFSRGCPPGNPRSTAVAAFPSHHTSRLVSIIALLAAASIAAERRAPRLGI